MRVIPIKDDGSLLPSAKRAKVDRLFAFNLHTGWHGIANRFGTSFQSFPVDRLVFTNRLRRELSAIPERRWSKEL